MSTAIKHLVLDRVKLLFVIFDYYNWQLNPVWHRMLYSCTHMATMGVKGLSFWKVLEEVYYVNENRRLNNEILFLFVAVNHRFAFTPVKDVNAVCNCVQRMLIPLLDDSETWYKRPLYLKR